MPSFNPKRVEIYNSLGQMVLQSDQWVDLDISTLTSGIYFAKMNMWDGMYSVSEFLKL
ncbi:MAG: T9SS type A sorting domain-containing protein [Saprospiraceae bacterium]|nr:T9SS type A sorting domain-containing protein [Candidatus Parvibacillus calidus]